MATAQADPSLYDFDFDAVFDIIELRHCFKTYANKECKKAYESYQFLTTLEQYLAYVGCSARYKAAMNIIDSYLRDNKQICVSSKQRQELLDKASTLNETSCPANLFDNLRTSVCLHLKDEYLIGFFGSTTFSKFIKEVLKEDPDYLSKIGILKSSRNSSDIIHSSKLKITEEDFQYALDNFYRSESDWTTTESTETCSQSVARNMRRPKRFNDMREVMVLPCSAQEAYNITTCTFEYRTKILKAQKSSNKFLDISVHGCYSSTTVHITSQLPFPMQNRDFSAIYSARREKNGDILMLAKNANNPNIPIDKKHVRGTFFNMKLFQNIDSGCKVTSITQIDFAGYMSPTLFNKMVKYKKSDNEIYDLIIVAIEERKKNNQILPDPGHPLTHLLTHFDEFRASSTQL